MVVLRRRRSNHFESAYDRADGADNYSKQFDGSCKSMSGAYSPVWGANNSPSAAKPISSMYAGAKIPSLSGGFYKGEIALELEKYTPLLLELPVFCYLLNEGVAPLFIGRKA